MDGIYDMLRILMELVAERLKQAPIPVVLLDVLAMVWKISVTVLYLLVHCACTLYDNVQYLIRYYTLSCKVKVRVLCFTHAKLCVFY